MQESAKKPLSAEWMAIAEQVDAYESDSSDGKFPELRAYADRVDPAMRGAVLVELVKVDLERRWQAGQHRKVEDYLGEYPELSEGDISIEDIVRQEFQVRASHGDDPTVAELRSRFPDLDEHIERILHLAPPPPPPTARPDEPLDPDATDQPESSS